MPSDKGKENGGKGKDKEKGKGSAEITAKLADLETRVAALESASSGAAPSEPAL